MIIVIILIFILLALTDLLVLPLSPFLLLTLYLPLLYSIILHNTKYRRISGIQSRYWSLSKIVGLTGVVLYTVLVVRINSYLPNFGRTFYTNDAAVSGEAASGILVIIALPVIGLLMILFPHIFRCSLESNRHADDTLLTDGFYTFFGCGIILISGLVYFLFS